MLKHELWFTNYPSDMLQWYCPKHMRIRVSTEKQLCSTSGRLSCFYWMGHFHIIYFPGHHLASVYWVQFGGQLSAHVVSFGSTNPPISFKISNSLQLICLLTAHHRQPQVIQPLKVFLYLGTQVWLLVSQSPWASPEGWQGCPREWPGSLRFWFHERVPSDREDHDSFWLKHMCLGQYHCNIKI